MDFSREEIVRRLLGVATQLFIEDKDPISVRCLASSASEHAAFLAKQNEANSFNDHVLEVFSEISQKQLQKLKNQHWNSIKHSKDVKGLARNPIEELSNFSDETNDHTLFVVWYDYGEAGLPLPIAAQVFQIWYFEMYPEKIDPDHAEKHGITCLFENILNKSRAEQKAYLKSQCLEHLKDSELVSHKKTDPRSLVLS